MTNATRFRLPFRVSVSLAFTLISVPLLAAVIGILYLRNAQIARELAAETMERASTAIANDIDALLGPVAQAVEATATLGKIDRGALRRAEAFQYYLRVLESVPHADSIYVGFERDGSFYQAARLPPEVTRFGPSGARPSKDARFALRILDASSGEMADSYIYLAKWADVVSVERGPVRFDPRKRPWYAAAWRNAGLSISDAYVFFSSGRPGLTLSQRIATDGGSLIGAVGADISLAALSEFLARERVGTHGVAIVVDESGRLIGYPGLDAILRQKGSDLTLPRADEIDDRRVSQAVRLREAGAGNRFRAELADGTYLVSFTRLPAQFNKDWWIGVIAAERDFVGRIQQTSLFMLALGAVAMAISILAIFWMSSSLTRPIGRAVAETKRIRNFDLGEGLGIRSRIIEIQELADALDAMQEGLRSFGAYIPKALVQTIVASGKSTGIGGERRTLTLMFTDLENFTRHSETLPPEQVLVQLSSYFKAISGCIHDHGGTVDKFIGDAVMAFWNAPLADPGHATNACRAALRCRAVSRRLNADFAAAGHSPMLTRFGLHTGDVVVGNVGSADRMQYTALGAQVNVAARIEGLNKQYGTQLIATGALEELVRDHFLFRPLDLVVPAGTSQVIPLFELIGSLSTEPDRATDEEIAACNGWQTAMALYRARNWSEALDRFGNYAKDHPEDRPARLYVQRCESLLKAPPPPDWDGAEHYDTK
jgi:adenylate cyclase